MVRERAGGGGYGWNRGQQRGAVAVGVRECVRFFGGKFWREGRAVTDLGGGLLVVVELVPVLQLGHLGPLAVVPLLLAVVQHLRRRPLCRGEVQPHDGIRLDLLILAAILPAPLILFLVIIILIFLGLLGLVVALFLRLVRQPVMAGFAVPVVVRACSVVHRPFAGNAHGLRVGAAGSAGDRGGLVGVFARQLRELDRRRGLDRRHGAAYVCLVGERLLRRVAEPRTLGARLLGSVPSVELVDGHADRLLEWATQAPGSACTWHRADVSPLRQLRDHFSSEPLLRSAELPERDFFTAACSGGGALM